MTDAKAAHGGGGKANRIFVASDGTGRTAYLTVSAAMVQFPGARVKIVVRPDVRTKERAHEVVREAAEAGGFVVHTFVTDEVHDELVKAARELNVEAIDLMGPLIARLTETLADLPVGEAGPVQPAEQGLFPAHRDDGVRPQPRRRPAGRGPAEGRAGPARGVPDLQDPAQHLPRLQGLVRRQRPDHARAGAAGHPGQARSRQGVLPGHERPAAGRSPQDAGRLPQRRGRRLRRSRIRADRADARPPVLRPSHPGGPSST